MKKAIVVGSGIAGIASAIRLQNKGYKVQILEKNSLSEESLPNLTEMVLDLTQVHHFTMPNLVTELLKFLKNIL
jgi:2-polyprenyl-6-methoxyphenol hydroxylase-like FAD-dependent oxidoreductase